MTAFLNGCYCFSLSSLCRHSTSVSGSRSWVCPSEKPNNSSGGWKASQAHSICKQAECFKLTLAFDPFWQVLGRMLENLGPEIEKQFLKTSDTISAAWHKFKTRLDKYLENTQLVEVVDYVPSVNYLLGEFFGFYMWRPIPADICSDLPCFYLLSESIWRWSCWKKRSRSG